MSGGGGSREEERRKLADIINHWNANRLDLFEISDPTEVSDPGKGLPPGRPGETPRPGQAAPRGSRAPAPPPAPAEGSGTGSPALAEALFLGGEPGSGPSPCLSEGRLQWPRRGRERRAGVLLFSLPSLPQAHAGLTLRDRGETRWEMAVAKGGGQGRE